MAIFSFLKLSRKGMHTPKGPQNEYPSQPLRIQGYNLKVLLTSYGFSKEFSMKGWQMTRSEAVALLVAASDIFTPLGAPVVQL